MEDFKTYYFTEKKDDSKSSWLSRLFSKNKVKTIGVKADNLLDVKAINRSSYNSLLNGLAREYKRKGKESNSIYIKDLFAGKLKDQGLIFDLDFDNVEDITVYKTNTGGKLYLFNLLDNNNTNHYYIGINNKAQSFFKVYVGMTFGAFASKADSILKRYETIKTKKENPWLTPLQTISQDKKIIDVGKVTSPNNPSSVDNNVTTDEKEYGFVDINNIQLDNLIEEYDGGSGKSSKKFPGVFKREKFANNIGSGYRYVFTQSDKGSIYLIKLTDDEERGLIIFEGKESRNWAEKMGMLDMWIGEKSPLKPIRDVEPHWQKVDIKNIN